MQGHTIPDIQQFGRPLWPDVQELIQQCLQYKPQHRPSAQEIFDHFCWIAFVGLKRVYPIYKGSRMEACITRVSRGWGREGQGGEGKGGGMEGRQGRGGEGGR